MFNINEWNHARSISGLTADGEVSLTLEPDIVLIASALIHMTMSIKILSLMVALTS